MNLSFDAPLPQRFRQRPEGIPTSSIATRKYERSKFASQMKQIDDVTAGIETDVVALETQLMAYVKQSAVFQQFLPRIQFIIDAMQQSEKKHIQETAAAFQNALQVLQSERDELFEDLPLSYQKLEKLNAMQREFVTRLSAIQRTLPVTPDIEALEKYLWETKTTIAPPLPQQQPNTRQKEAPVTVTAPPPPAPERPDSFWDYWTLLIETFRNKVKADPTYRIDAVLTPTEERKVLVAIEQIYGIAVPTYAPTSDSVQTLLLKDKIDPDPKRLAPLCAVYPPVLTVVAGKDKRCVDLFVAAAEIVEGNAKDGNGIIARAKTILDGYYVLADRLQMKRVYINRALQTPLWYRASSDATPTKVLET